MGKELIEHIKKLLQQKQEIDAELKEARDLLVGGEHVGPSAETVPRLRVPSSQAQRWKGKPTTGLYKPDSSVGLAVGVLRDFEKPLHINEMIARIEQRGHKVKKATLVGMIASYVKRGLVFERVKPNTFGLLEWKQGKEGK